MSDPTDTRPIHTQADLEELWRDLMSPLGFGQHSLWLMFVTADGEPLRRLTQLEGALEPPGAEDLAGLAAMLASVIPSGMPGGRVAFLRSRPGRGGPDARDRVWASVLYAACRAAGVAAEVVHVATDDTVAPVPMDALRS